ncbi:hypothetical protein AAA447_01250 [Staphylococcus equorum]
MKSSYPVKVILEVFNIPKFTYYRWKRKNYEVDSVEEKALPEACPVRERQLITPRLNVFIPR